MFKVNDYVMYGMTGACKVIDIVSEKFINGEDRRYYVLNPLYYRDTVIKAPVDNSKISIRKIISKEDMTSLIKDIDNTETVWIEDEKKRSSKFREMLKTGQCDKLMKLVKSINVNIEHTKSLGKKSHKVDEDIMTEAERLINEEFAVILDISPNEVDEYIKSILAEENK